MGRPCVGPFILFIESSYGTRAHRVLTAGLRPARMKYPHLQPRGLQIPETINPRGTMKRLFYSESSAKRK